MMRGPAHRRSPHLSCLSSSADVIQMSFWTTWFMPCRAGCSPGASDFMVLPASGAEIKPAQYEHCKGIDVLGCPADCYVCLENGADD